jgi:hypothetical protein
MSKQYRDPGPRSQSFALCETRGPPLGKYVIVEPTNRAQALRSIRCNSAIAGLVITTLFAGAPGLAVAQNVQADSSSAARAGAIAHAQKMRRLFPDIDGDTQATPPIIPQLEIDRDPSGAIATFQPNGFTVTAKNAFFQNLGTNERNCFTCHQPKDGWSLSA